MGFDDISTRLAIAVAVSFAEATCQILPANSFISARNRVLTADLSTTRHIDAAHSSKLVAFRLTVACREVARPMLQTQKISEN